MFNGQSLECQNRVDQRDVSARQCVCAHFAAFEQFQFGLECVDFDGGCDTAGADKEIVETPIVKCPVYVIEPTGRLGCDPFDGYIDTAKSHYR